VFLYIENLHILEYSGYMGLLLSRLPFIAKPSYTIEQQSLFPCQSLLYYNTAVSPSLPNPPIQWYSRLSFPAKPSYIIVQPSLFLYQTLLYNSTAVSLSLPNPNTTVQPSLFLCQTLLYNSTAVLANPNQYILHSTSRLSFHAKLPKYSRLSFLAKLTKYLYRLSFLAKLTKYLYRLSFLAKP
jgi:hypothetical protein